MQNGRKPTRWGGSEGLWVIWPKIIGVAEFSIHMGICCKNTHKTKRGIIDSTRQVLHSTQIYNILMQLRLGPLAVPLKNARVIFDMFRSLLFSVILSWRPIANRVLPCSNFSVTRVDIHQEADSGQGKDLYFVMGRKPWTCTPQLLIFTELPQSSLSLDLERTSYSLNSIFDYCSQSEETFFNFCGCTFLAIHLLKGRTFGDIFWSEFSYPYLATQCINQHTVQIFTQRGAYCWWGLGGCRSWSGTGCWAWPPWGTPPRLCSSEPPPHPHASHLPNTRCSPDCSRQAGKHSQDHQLQTTMLNVKRSC